MSTFTSFSVLAHIHYVHSFTTTASQCHNSHVESMIPVDGETRHLESLDMHYMDITTVSANKDPLRSKHVRYAGWPIDKIRGASTNHQ